MLEVTRGEEERRRDERRRDEIRGEEKKGERRGKKVIGSCLEKLYYTQVQTTSQLKSEHRKKKDSFS